MSGFAISKCLRSFPLTRVSSDNTAFTSLSVSRARSVISPRLPIGVATIKSVPDIGEKLEMEELFQFHRLGIRTNDCQVQLFFLKDTLGNPKHVFCRHFVYLRYFFFRKNNFVS